MYKEGLATLSKINTEKFLYIYADSVYKKILNYKMYIIFNALKY